MEETEKSATSTNKAYYLKLLGAVLIFFGFLFSSIITLFYSRGFFIGPQMLIDSKDFVLFAIGIQLEVIGLALILSERKK